MKIGDGDADFDDRGGAVYVHENDMYKMKERDVKLEVGSLLYINRLLPADMRWTWKEVVSTLKLVLYSEKRSSAQQGKRQNQYNIK